MLALEPQQKLLAPQAAAVAAQLAPLLMTRWHGMTMQRRLRPLALPTAPGAPMPAGDLKKGVQTLRVQGKGCWRPWRTSHG